jgi:N-acylneuraminate cytidylyltransferase
MYGADIIFRLEEFARSDSPDIQFVKHMISSLRMKSDDTFVLLRPTNPFRTAQTIKRAWREWAMGQPADSLRAVSHVKQHPYKMWKIGAQRWMLPMSDKRIEGTPVHDMPTQELPLMLVQNGCIQIARAEIVRTFGDYTGETVLPFYTELYEGFDLNIEDDWLLAETLICKGIAKTEPMGD